jgi:hypothetical protein
LTYENPDDILLIDVEYDDSGSGIVFLTNQNSNQTRGVLIRGLSGRE